METFKKKFNKSEIFKTAWNLVRRKGLTFSEALKSTWAITKKVAEIKAKELAERIAKFGMPNTTMVSASNQLDFSLMDMPKITGVYQTTVAR